MFVHIAKINTSKTIFYLLYFSKLWFVRVTRTIRTQCEAQKCNPVCNGYILSIFWGWIFLILNNLRNWFEYGLLLVITNVCPPPDRGGCAPLLEPDSSWGFFVQPSEFFLATVGLGSLLWGFRPGSAVKCIVTFLFVKYTIQIHLIWKHYFTSIFMHLTVKERHCKQTAKQVLICANGLNCRNDASIIHKWFCVAQ